MSWRRSSRGCLTSLIMRATPPTVFGPSIKRLALWQNTPWSSGRWRWWPDGMSFGQGLNQQLQGTLALRGEPTYLNTLISLAIELDNHLGGQRREQSVLMKAVLRHCPLPCSAQLHRVPSSRALPHRQQFLCPGVSPCRWVEPDSHRRGGGDDSVPRCACTVDSRTTISSCPQSSWSLFLP